MSDLHLKSMNINFLYTIRIFWQHSCFIDSPYLSAMPLAICKAPYLALKPHALELYLLNKNCTMKYLESLYET